MPENCCSRSALVPESTTFRPHRVTTFIPHLEVRSRCCTSQPGGDWSTLAVHKPDYALGVPLLYGSLNMTARKISRLPIGSILRSVIAPNDTSVEI
jgi:hypothetical protein